jgi:hypothetical protein
MSIAAMIRLGVILAIVLFISSSAAVTTETALSCSSVILEVSLCVDFIINGSPQPSQQCCNGVKDLNDKIIDKADQQALCQCIQQVLFDITYDPSRITLLGNKCGLSDNLPPIDHNTDCTM